MEKGFGGKQSWVRREVELIRGEVRSMKLTGLLEYEGYLKIGILLRDLGIGGEKLPGLTALSQRLLSSTRRLRGIVAIKDADSNPVLILDDRIVLR